MSIFQNTIFQKYLKTLNQETIHQKWEVFKGHFHNIEIQENIRNSKEEQYQGEFLIDLFVNVLGYTKNPTPKFNLTTEYKNVKDSKKADGAIIINDKVVGIIELKGTNTTDLSKIEDQAFGYKNNQPDCKYIITSNFEKIRFYIDNAIDHLEFNLFTLSEEDFKQLYLCLSFESLNNDIPKKIKDESLSQEDTITKKLYKDYSLFKRELFQNLTELNPDINQLELFKKSQKLIDRFLFLFFGEDRFLLPPNSVRLILSDWRDLLDRDEQIPLYDRFKKYFGYLNTGFEGKRYSVFAYNGGLFKPDEILDNITIDSELLYKHTLKLSEYDFGSEVDVNILGHIFENSLNEIDEIKAQLEGQEIDKSKTKRKKDGVFYTPKYITKYIVENTVGKLCEEKKVEIGILEEEYFTDKKRQQKTKLSLLQKLDDYRNWLHQITIIDPACGSGAFLNEALNFLISEHKYIDELEAKLTGSSIAFAYHSASILENNLFGVDLNEESVEIAKLSLWLRTAEPNRKLNDLSNNIKCGNSLIDDPEIAGDKAFNWEKEFPQIFAKGGFDVVIGNPPYVQLQSMGSVSENLKKMNYQTFEKTSDLYCLFHELGNNILKENGLLGFITSNKWLRANYGKSLRNYLLENTQPIELIDLGSGIFESATVDSNILIFEKTKVNNKPFIGLDISKEKTFIDFNIYENSKVEINPAKDDIWAFSSSLRLDINDKIERLGVPLADWNIKINRGVLTGFNEAFIIDEETKNSLISKEPKSSEIIIPILRGRDVHRYSIEYANLYLINTHNGYGKTPKIEIEDYPIIKEYLDQYKSQLEKRTDKGDTYYNLRNCAYLDDFFKEKIIYPETTVRRGEFYFTNDYIITDKTCFILVGENLKYLNTLLASKLFTFYLEDKLRLVGPITIQYSKQYLSDIKFKLISSFEQQPFINKAEKMLSLNKELQEVLGKFQRTLQREFSLETPSKKLQNWYELSFAEFLKELTKAKVNLSLSLKAEWEDYFLAEQQKAVSIKSKIDQTDKEIDQMVYNLYGLTKEEIEIVENS